MESVAVDSKFDFGKENENVSANLILLKSLSTS
jgi:hypothetical protein